MKRAFFRKKITRLFLKSFIWITSILLGLLVLILALATIFFPSEQVRRLAIKELSSTLNRPVQIEQARINLLKGIELNRCVLFEVERFATPPPPQALRFVSINQLLLKYKLWPLLRRQLIIHKIIIDSPEVNLIQDSTGVWNFDDLIAPADTLEPILEDSTQIDTTEFNLPFAIQLEQFEIKDLALKLALVADSSLLDLELASLTGRVTDLNTPRGGQSSIFAQLKAQIQLLMDQAQLHFRLSSPTDKLAFDTDVNLNFTVNSKGLDDITSQFHLAFEQFELTEFKSGPDVFVRNSSTIPELLSLQFAATGNLDSTDFQISNLQLDLLEQPLLHAEQANARFSAAPVIQLEVTHSEFDLSRLIRLAAQFKSPLFDELLAIQKLEGQLSLAGSRISSNSASATETGGLHFDWQLKLNNLSLNYDNNLIQLDDSDLLLKLVGDYVGEEFRQLTSTGQLTVPHLIIAADDTFNLDFERLTLTLDAKLSSDFIPQTAQILLNVDNFGEAQLDFSAQLNALDQLQNLSFESQLNATGLELEQLQVPELTGTADLELALQAPALDQIRLNLKGTLAPLAYQLETGWINLNPQLVQGSMRIKTDTLFTDFFIDPVELRVNDYLKIQASGELLNYGENGFTVTLNPAEVMNQKLYDELPEAIVSDIGFLEISGRTTLTGDLKGLLPADSLPDFRGVFTLQTDDVDLNYPEAFLEAWDIKLHSTMNLFPDSLTAFVKTNIDSVALTDLRQRPFQRQQLTATVKMPFFQQVLIPSCSLKLADLATIVTVTGQIDSLETEPEINLDAHLHFQHETPIEIIEDVAIKGQARVLAHLYLYGDLLAVNGRLECQPLDVFSEGIFLAQGITGEIPFNQRMDIEALHLIRDELPLERLTQLTAVEYSYLRPYYKNVVQPVSTFQINQIEVAGFEFSNLTFDLLVGGAKIIVPRFFIDAYEGNIQGQCTVDLGEGNLEYTDELLDSLRFQLQATFSNINTAKLNALISAKAKKSRINANLALVGEGLNPEGDVDVKGQFHITEIGPKVASNLLLALDPNGVDQGIQSVRRLLRFQYKPKLMSFEIKHGHFYPSIKLSKPFYLPISIAGNNVELNRIPIQIFIKQAMASPYYID